MGIRASEEGLKRIQAAIEAKGWAPNSKKWTDLVIKLNTPQVEHPEIDSDLENFSPASWGRFIRNEGTLSLQLFRWCCNALGLDSEEIRSPDENTSPGLGIYIDRGTIEQLCRETIAQPRSLLRIKAPWRVGKSLLLERLLQEASDLGQFAVRIDFGALTAETLADLRLLYGAFGQRIRRSTKIGATTEDIWQQQRSANDNFTAYLDEILEAIDRPLMVAIDNLERIFPQETAAVDLCALLRACHEETLPDYQKLRLVLVYATDDYPKLDLNRSPFNVGVAAELGEFEFSPQDERLLRWLAHYGVNLDTKQQQTATDWIGGHPALWEALIWACRGQQISWEQLWEDAPTEGGVFGDHFRVLRDRLQGFLERSPQARIMAQQALVSSEPIEIDRDLAFKLYSMGLVWRRGDAVVSRNRLYREYFGRCYHQ